MPHQDLQDKLMSIYNKIDQNYHQINKNLALLDTQPLDSETRIHINQIKKCCLQLKQTLHLLHESKVSDGMTACEVFLAKIRHDLINPVNGIMGYSEMILENHDSQSIKNIVLSSEMILNFISQITHVCEKDQKK